MISVLDYGCGNTYAFINAFKYLNIPASVAKKAEDLKGVKKIILPGVGSFDYVMKNFNNSGLRDTVEKMVFIDRVDVLGVCAGMQIFAEQSEEGVEKGLSWIKGEIRLFDISKINFKPKLPHMGWNKIMPKESPIFNNINDESRFYFVHSYFFDNDDCENTISTSLYGGEFTSSVKRKNIYGVQFHPEKSHQNGLTLLKNFAYL